MKISELSSGMRAVSVQAKILEISDPREVTSRFDGRVNRVATAVIDDESGKINLTLWNQQIESVAVNGTVEVENGYVTEFRGTKQLSTGRYGTLKVIK